MTRSYNREMTNVARDLRRRATDAERRLWEIVRARRCGGYRFLRQVPAGQYILDFYCAAARLCIEVDGPIHERSAVRERDGQRQEALEEELHLRFLRLTNDEVLETEEDALRQRILTTVEAAKSRLPEGEPRIARRR